jgi:hypothetical protein
MGRHTRYPGYPGTLYPEGQNESIWQLEMAGARGGTREGRPSAGTTAP